MVVIGESIYSDHATVTESGKGKCIAPSNFQDIDNYLLENYEIKKKFEEEIQLFKEGIKILLTIL